MGGLGAALFLALGTLALGAVAIRRVEGGATTRFGLALAVGTALSALLLYVPLAAFGRVSFVPVLAAQVLALLVAARRARPSRTAATLTAACLALAALACVEPYQGYDGKAIFGFKAKALWCERGVDGPAFQDPDVVHYHGDYPLGVPLLGAYAAWLAEGAPEDPLGERPAASAAEWVARYDAIEAYTPFAALFGVAVVALLAGAARERGASRRGAALLVLATCPAALLLPWVGGREWSLEGADVPLALALGALAVGAGRVLRGERGGTELVALAAFGAVVLKNDALLALATLAPAALLAAPNRRGVWLVASVAAGAGVAFALVMPVRAATVGAPFDEDYGAALAAVELGTVVARAPVLARASFDVLESKGQLALLAFVWLIAAPLGLQAGGERRALALWVLLHGAGTLAVFLITPDRVSWHVLTALPRLVAHTAVPAGVLVAAVLSDPYGVRLQVGQLRRRLCSQ